MSMPAEKVIEIVKKNIGKRPVVVGFNAPKTTLAVKGSAILNGDVFLDLQDEATDRMEKMNADAEAHDSAKSVRAILGSLRKQYLQGEVGAVNKILQDAGTGWFATPPIEGDRVIRVKDMAKMRSLPAEAFYNCDAEKLVIPSTITTIGEDFCAVCPNLKQVVFEGPVKEIPPRAFEATDALETVAFNVPGLEKIGEGAFRSSGIRHLRLPMTVKEIGDNAFEKCKRLEWITAYGVEKIGKGAFRGCENLKYPDFFKCKDLAGTGIDEIEIATEAKPAGPCELFQDREFAEVRGLTYPPGFVIIAASTNLIERDKPMKTIKRFLIVDFFEDDHTIPMDDVIKALEEHLEEVSDEVDSPRKAKKLQDVMKKDIAAFEKFAKDAKVGDTFTLNFSDYDPSIDNIVCASEEIAKN